jgi:hypothetical protein
LTTRAECDEESNGFGGKSDGNEGVNNQLAMGACDKESEGSKAMAMAMGIRVVGDKEGEGNKEGDVVGNEGGVWRREQMLQQQEQWQ